MGIEIGAYRARIGLFALCCKVAKLKRKHEKYTRYTSGSDVHLRTFVTSIYILAILMCCHGSVRSRVYFEETFATSLLPACNLSSFKEVGATMASCSEYGGQYLSRIILLSGDVELNPGPKSGPTSSGDVSNENTHKILQAINSAKNEIDQVKSEIKGLRSEVSGVKSELVYMKGEILSIGESLHRVETDQEAVNERVSKVEEVIEIIKFDQDVLTNDMGHYSMQHEINDQRLNLVEHQLSIIESDRLKNSLRVFGLRETESSEDSLKQLIQDEVLSVTGDENFSDDALLSARRVGEKREIHNDSDDIDGQDNGDSARMVIVKFRYSDDKFKLFKFRTTLREKGIRISNDLSYIQRQQLKLARSKGLVGYFKNGTMVTYAKDDQVQKRVFVRARRNNDNEMDVGNDRSVAPMDVVNVENVDDISSSQGAVGGEK